MNAESHTNARGQLCIHNLNERDVPNLYLPIPFVKYKPEFSFSSTFKRGMWTFPNQTQFIDSLHNLVYTLGISSPL